MTDPNHPNHPNHPNRPNRPNDPSRQDDPNRPDYLDRLDDARDPDELGSDAMQSPQHHPVDPHHPDHLSEPMSPPHPYYEELEFLSHREEPVRFTVRFGDDRRPPGRPGVLARRATLGAGWPVLQFRLAASAQADPHAYDLLEREVAAAVSLERRYGEEKFGAVFARIVGFDLAAPEPFVLYRMPGGRPLAEWAGRLGPEEQERIIGQLAFAVRLLERVDLVHRAVTPDTVRWDGAHVRLCEPFAALRAGEAREPFGGPPWASPEQREGLGPADPRDDLWSVAQLGYYLLSGRPARGEGPPGDLADYRRLAALAQSGLFSPRAADRPRPVELMRLLNVPDPLATAAGAADRFARGRAEYDRQLARKRAVFEGGAPPAAEPYGGSGDDMGDPALDPRSSRTTLIDRIFGGGEGPGRPAAPASPLEPSPAPPSRSRMCPHCLLPVEYDERLLVTIDAKGNRIPLDLSGERRPAHIADALRKAYHLCPHTVEGDEEHELPVPYLTNGEPLSVALVGSSSVGKTHLLAAMLGEIELGGLAPYGLRSRPLNPEAHRTYLRERVQNLQQGRQLGRTGQQTFARFADGLLVSAGGGTPRPVVFFDLAGEDLAQDGEVARFLMGVDAFVFVLDPLRALRLGSLDPVRDQSGLRRRDLGDEAFATVLDRIPRQRGGLVAAPAALAVNKSDLVRFEPSVDRWLGRALPGRYDPAEAHDESRDAYAFLAHHASAAWLKPFDDCANCSLHFVAATGGQARGDRFPHGVRPRRVLAPLLSLFAMCGLLPGAEPMEGIVR
ncbi:MULTISPECIES: hypothetical protein [Streptomyces]|uniref:Protein kinase domain-containing protein n=1 Tax=Streptomyces venezuelae TaxID=54571 RepID=A0A5P2ASP2_STRVZ|nr:hypothetical protein [Streptomyces venezuelae]QES19269.1 hypothetical protein DEJ46_09330 [Streptomyces venezuelae]